MSVVIFSQSNKHEDGRKNLALKSKVLRDLTNTSLSSRLDGNPIGKSIEVDISNHDISQHDGEFPHQNENIPHPKFTRKHEAGLNLPSSPVCQESHDSTWSKSSLGSDFQLSSSSSNSFSSSEIQSDDESLGSPLRGRCVKEDFGCSILEQPVEDKVICLTTLALLGRAVDQLEYEMNGLGCLDHSAILVDLVADMSSMTVDGPHVETPFPGQGTYPPPQRTSPQQLEATSSPEEPPSCNGAGLLASLLAAKEGEVRALSTHLAVLADTAQRVFDEQNAELALLRRQLPAARPPPRGMPADGATCTEPSAAAGPPTRAPAACAAPAGISGVEHDGGVGEADQAASSHAAHAAAAELRKRDLLIEQLSAELAAAQVRPIFDQHLTGV
jgi:hypothetical protein